MVRYLFIVIILLASCTNDEVNYEVPIIKELEISSDISSIWSRHSFATQMKRNNVSPYIIQEAFGHRDIKTTENYMSSLLEDDMRNIQEKL